MPSGSTRYTRASWTRSSHSARASHASGSMRSDSNRPPGHVVVALDGPAGAGKSTAARMLAERLGYVLVDTGALYRGVALASLEAGVSWDDASGLAALIERLALSLERGPDGR